MAWPATLHLDYHLDPPANASANANANSTATGTANAATRRRSRHDGPLRVLKSLYPEGPAVCHDVLVHPPGGLVGGDTLDVHLGVERGAHALVTSPSAARFYRSTGERATQAVDARVAPGARLEWLPLETLVYDGARGASRLAFTLDDGAEMIGWDLVALGLPAAGLPFARGEYAHEIALPGRWLDRGVVRADDVALLDGPCGWDGCRALATLWFATGSTRENPRTEALVEAARAVIDAHPLAPRAGVTASHEGLVVMRALAPRIEPLFELARAVRAAWREAAWSMPAAEPRVWRT